MIRLSCQLVGCKAGEEAILYGYNYSYHMDHFVIYQDRHLDSNQIMKFQKVYLYSKICGKPNLDSQWVSQALLV